MHAAAEPHHETEDTISADPAASGRRHRKFDPAAWLILVLAAFLIFYGLGHRPLWQDEAETACLAKNVLKFGLPVGYDGLNLISQEERREYKGGTYLWRWSPWLQIYVSAAGQWIGGSTTTAARFPFALAGLAAIWAVYVILRCRFEDPDWARMAALLLALSVPFLLYVRQGRYYAIGALLTAASLYAFRSQWQKRFAPAALLVCSLALLFYCNYLLFFSYVPAMILAAVLVYRREIPLKRTLALGSISALMVVPGILLSRMGHQAGLVESRPLIGSLDFYVQDAFMFMVPLPLVVYLLWRWRRIFLFQQGLPEDPRERFVFFLFLIGLGNIVLLALIPQRYNRYLSHIYPISAIIAAWLVVKLRRYHRISGLILALLLSLTNWLHVIPMDYLNWGRKSDQVDFHMIDRPNIPLLLHLTELFSKYPDVNKAMIHFFRNHAEPGQTIFTTYGDLPLQFYTDNRVIGSLQGPVPPLKSPPEWVVTLPLIGFGRTGEPLYSDQYLRKHINLKKDYHPIVINGFNEPFGNRADPYHHRFVTPLEPFKRVIVYRRIRK